VGDDDDAAVLQRRMGGVRELRRIARRIARVTCRSRTSDTSISVPTLAASEPGSSSYSGLPSERDAFGRYRWPKRAGVPADADAEASWRKRWT